MEGERPLLMIPGPVELDQRVLAAAGSSPMSHVDPVFIKTFGSALKMVKEAFLAPDGAPFVVAGSGSLGWDMFGANVLEDGDSVLVIAHGKFGDSFAEWLGNQGAKVTVVEAAVPGSFPLEALKKLDNLKRFKAATITHVDTSTAVVAPVREVVSMLRAGNPDIIICVDSVAGLGGEMLDMQGWDIDYVMTGSQKALSVPPGLCVSVARRRALEAARSRKSPVRFTYVSWAKWIPIMDSYMAEKGSYFATPPVQLICSLKTGLEIHLANGGTIARFREHAVVARAFRAGISALNLKVLATEQSLAANTLSAIYYPEGVDGELFRNAVKKHGAVIAGGLHKTIQSKYFRVGHMGYSVYGGRKEHMLVVLAAIEAALKEQGYSGAHSAVGAFEASLKGSAL